MSDVCAKTGVECTSNILAGGGLSHSVAVRHSYEVECRDSAGNLKWAERFDNLVVTEGRNRYLDSTLKTGDAAPAWYVGLVTGPGAGNTYAAADVMNSHAGWAENTSYSNGTRPAYTPGAVAAGSVDNSASKAVFNINGTATIAGAFMSTNSTKGGTTGVLLGVGNFDVGDRSVVSGDTVSVTVTATMAAALERRAWQRLSFQAGTTAGLRSTTPSSSPTCSANLRKSPGLLRSTSFARRRTPLAGSSLVNISPSSSAFRTRRYG